MVLLETYGRPVDDDREAMLDELGSSTPPAVRPLADALVTPLARLLGGSAGGRAYLQVKAEIVARPGRFAAVLELVTRRPSLVRWSALVEPILPTAAVLTGDGS